MTFVFQMVADALLVINLRGLINSGIFLHWNIEIIRTEIMFNLRDLKSY
jgi:hypothetical protein